MIANPLNKLTTQDERTKDFLSAMGVFIEDETSHKDFLFLGDGNHRQSTPSALVYSRPFLEILAAAGFKQLLVEYGMRSDNTLYQSIADEVITPEQYVMLDPDFNIVGGSPETSAEQRSYIAQGIKDAAELGIRIQSIGAAEGMIKPEDQKKFLFRSEKRNELWLKYTLSNSKYFTAPQELLSEMVRNNHAFLTKARVVPASLTAFDDATARIKIRAIWRMMNLGKTFQDPNTLVNTKIISRIDAGKKTEEDIVAIQKLIVKRRKSDAAIMQYVDETYQQGKTAIFYGLAHIRNSSGGFVQSLSPDQYAVAHLIPDADPTAVLSVGLNDGHMAPSDMLVFLDNGNFLRLSDLGEPAQPRSLKILPNYKKLIT